MGLSFMMPFMCQITQSAQRRWGACGACFITLVDSENMIRVCLYHAMRSGASESLRALLPSVVMVIHY